MLVACRKNGGMIPKNKKSVKIVDPVDLSYDVKPDKPWKE
jgi:hypothetical protein